MLRIVLATFSAIFVFVAGRVEAALGPAPSSTRAVSIAARPMPSVPGVTLQILHVPQHPAAQTPWDDLYVPLPRDYAAIAGCIGQRYGCVGPEHYCPGTPGLCAVRECSLEYSVRKWSGAGSCTGGCGIDVDLCSLCSNWVVLTVSVDNPTWQDWNSVCQTNWIQPPQFDCIWACVEDGATVSWSIVCQTTPPPPPPGGFPNEDSIAHFPCCSQSGQFTVSCP